MSAPSLHERYTMQTPLQGSKPNVRKAWDRKEHKNVIVKSFQDPYQAQLEFTAMQRLKDVCCAIQIRDTYFQECLAHTEWCIVMEYAEWGTLLDLLEKSPSRHLPEDWLISCTRQLIGGLFDLHSRGVVHGDIKPSNIVCRADGTLAFCDFGLSTVTNSTLNTPPTLEHCSGTPAFVAPEVLTIALKDQVPTSPSQRAAKQYDGFAADVWSLGVTLFVLATGSLPFDDPSEMGMFQKIISNRLYFPKTPKLSPRYQALLRSMLCKDPKQRAGTAELILHPVLGQ